MIPEKTIKKLRNIAEEMSNHHIKSYYVGGFVRDSLLGIETDDIDICLVGVTDPEQVEKILLSYFQSVTPLVGQKFPVWIATDDDGKKFDYAMARRETLVGNSRKDFEVVTADITIEDDLRRRDFTINAIAMEIITGKYIDPFGGIDNLLEGMLHPTSDAFKEDSLRVYRAARFLARFPRLWPSFELISACKQLTPNDISNERVGIELKKTMEQAEIPSRFFDFLRFVGWLKYHFIELYNLIDVPQNPDHHPEGDAYIHTLLSINEAKDWFTRTVMLCHDLGKATTTTIENLNWADYAEENKKGDKINLPIPNPEYYKVKSIGHEVEGKKMTRDLLTRIHYCDHKTIRQMETLVELHMIRTGISEKTVRKTLRKLMEKHLSYEQLVEVCRCDVSSRPPFAKYTPDIGQNRAKQLLENGDMEVIVTGEELIKMGYSEGPLIGELTKKALEWQDRGTLNKDNWKIMINQYLPYAKESKSNSTKHPQS